MSQLPMLLQSPAKARDTSADESKTHGNDDQGSKGIVVSPVPGRKVSAVPRVHCFEFKALLQAQRMQIIGQMRGGQMREKNAAGETGTSVIGSSRGVVNDGFTAADDEVSAAMVMMINNSRKLLNIEAALERIGDGSYGICIDCGVTIDRSQLKANPTALRCPPCQILLMSRMPLASDQ